LTSAPSISTRPANIKAEVRIDLDEPDATPLEKRQAPGFRKYFDALWKELAVHVE